MVRVSNLRGWGTIVRGVLILLMSLGWYRAVTSVEARQINWRGLANRDHVASDGKALTMRFVFELGSFRDSFVPTAMNRADWAAHWVAMDRTFYQEANRVFTSSVSVTSNVAPFDSGNRAYVWGYDPTAGASEWFLAGKASWTWPSPDSSALPLSWTISLTGVEVILGQVNTDVYLRTALVEAPLPILLPEAWRLMTFSTVELAQPSVSSWEADPDGDGLSNQLEYALASDPHGWTDIGEVWTSEMAGDGSEVVVSLAKRDDRLTLYHMEYSPSLAGESWLPITQHAGRKIIGSLGKDSYALSVADLSREFYRMRVSWFGTP